MPGARQAYHSAAAGRSPRGQLRRGIVRPARMPGSARWMPASIAQLPPVQVTRPVRPAARTSAISGRSMPLVLRSRLSWHPQPGGEREHVGEQRRAGRVAAIVVCDERAVATAADVHLEHVRAMLDRGCERLQRVLCRAGG